MKQRIRFTKTISQEVTYMDTPYTYATEGNLGYLTESTTDDGMQIVYADEFPSAFVVFSDEYEIIEPSDELFNGIQHSDQFTIDNAHTAFTPKDLT